MAETITIEGTQEVITIGIAGPQGNVSEHSALEAEAAHVPVPLASGAGVRGLTDDDFDEVQEPGATGFALDTTTGNLFLSTKVPDGARNTVHRFNRASYPVINDINARWTFTGVTVWAGVTLDIVMPNGQIASVAADASALTWQTAMNQWPEDGQVLVNSGGGGKNPPTRIITYTEGWGGQPIDEPEITAEGYGDIDDYMTQTIVGVTRESPITFEFGEFSFELDMRNADETVVDWQAVIDAEVGAGVLTLDPLSDSSNYLDFEYAGDLENTSVLVSEGLVETTERFEKAVSVIGRNGLWHSVQHSGEKRRAVVAAIRAGDYPVVPGNNFINWADYLPPSRGAEWFAVNEDTNTYLTCPPGGGGTYLCIAQCEGLGIADRELLLTKNSSDTALIDDVGLEKIYSYADKRGVAGTDNASQVTGLFEMQPGDWIDVNFFWWDASPATVGDMFVWLIRIPDGFAP